MRGRLRVVRDHEYYRKGARRGKNCGEGKERETGKMKKEKNKQEGGTLSSAELKFTQKKMAWRELNDLQTHFV